VRYSAEPAGLQRREDMEVRSEEAQGFDMTLSRTIPGPLMCLTMAIFPVFLHNFKFLALGLVFLSLVTSFLPLSWACSSIRAFAHSYSLFHVRSARTASASGGFLCIVACDSRPLSS
jgi:hypothetical protein